tara:strand:- start:68 stop:307 length:240 start_codon:yes stop_codon:yes gene_type:complete
MPQGKGTYGSKRGRPPKKSATKKVAKRLGKLAGKKIEAAKAGKTRKVKRIQTRAKKVVTKYTNKRKKSVGKYWNKLKKK